MPDITPWNRYLQVNNDATNNPLVIGSLTDEASMSAQNGKIIFDGGNYDVVIQNGTNGQMVEGVVSYIANIDDQLKDHAAEQKQDSEQLEVESIQVNNILETLLESHSGTWAGETPRDAHTIYNDYIGVSNLLVDVKTNYAGLAAGLTSNIQLFEDNKIEDLATHYRTQGQTIISELSERAATAISTMTAASNLMETKYFTDYQTEYQEAKNRLLLKTNNMGTFSGEEILATKARVLGDMDAIVDGSGLTSISGVISSLTALDDTQKAMISDVQTKYQDLKDRVDYFTSIAT